MSEESINTVVLSLMKEERLIIRESNKIIIDKLDKLYKYSTFIFSFIISIFSLMLLPVYSIPYFTYKEKIGSIFIIFFLFVFSFYYFQKIVKMTKLNEIKILDFNSILVEENNTEEVETFKSNIIVDFLHSLNSEINLNISYSNDYNNIHRSILNLIEISFLSFIQLLIFYFTKDGNLFGLIDTIYIYPLLLLVYFREFEFSLLPLRIRNGLIKLKTCMIRKN